MTTGVGTSRWLAPEVIIGGGSYDESCDVYSFGVLLSELDTHELPFMDQRTPTGVALPAIVLMELIASGEITPVFQSTCPPSLLSLARACLSFGAEERPTATTVGTTLRHLHQEVHRVKQAPSTPASLDLSTADRDVAPPCHDGDGPHQETMVKLFCAIVGVDGSAFPVAIDASETVGDLKNVIKAMKPQTIACDLAKLKLFLAKKGDVWLTENEVQRGRHTVAIINGLRHLNVARAQLRGVGLSDEDMAEVDDEEDAAGNGPVNVLVVVPAELAVAQPSFFWKEPKPLVRSIGAKWDFQSSLPLDDLETAIERHYDDWKLQNEDDQCHPLFMCIDGPGTGKSRLLDEFPNVLQQQIFRDEENRGNPAMLQLLRSAYTFKITFENEIVSNDGISGPGKMVGTRMLYQLQDSVAWSAFIANRANHVIPDEAMAKLSTVTGTALSDMCVILCVDSLQKLQHEPGNKYSDFFEVLSLLCDLVTASKCWVIAICSATIHQPVNEFLAVSSQWRMLLWTTSLERPKINGRDVFKAFEDGSNRALMGLLVKDMGGHGRALETLFSVMLQFQGKPFEFIPVMRAVLTAIRDAFPEIVTQMQSMRQAFLAVISRRRVDGHSRFGDLTLDQVISCGLIRLDGAGNRLECPFILYMLLETRDLPWNIPESFAPAKVLEGLKPWQLWEQFNGKFRALKSQAFAQEKNPVLWKDIHHGARFGAGCNRRVIERQLTCTLAKQRMRTKTKCFHKGSCSCGNDCGLLYQPAAGSPFGDAFLCLEDVDKGFFHEVHQYNCVEEKISLDVFAKERSKAAGPGDLFIMYCTGQVSADVLELPNSAFVDATCWEAYYGPFAARAFFVKHIPLPCINTIPEVQLEFVEGVGEIYRDRITKKRPFTSLEDAHEKTQIPMKVLKRFSFNAHSR